MPQDMAATNSWDEQSIADGKALIRRTQYWNLRVSMSRLPETGCRMLEAENVPLDNLPAEPPAVPHQVEAWQKLTPAQSTSPSALAGENSEESLQSCHRIMGS